MLQYIINPVLSVIGYNYKRKRAKDRELMKEFLEVLPSDGDSIRFLKEHDMANTAKFSYFQPLNIIREDWRAPDKEFQVSQLEKRKLKFIRKLDEFLSAYAQRSGGGPNGTISIGPRDREWDQDMRKYVERLNALASEAYERYEDFVRTAHKKI